MSRIGKQPIVIPAGVEVSIVDGLVKVKGPKGQLERMSHPSIKVEIVEEDGAKSVVISIADESDKKAAALWGTVRANINNMVVGVSEGFSKQLEVNGVGYKVALQGRILKIDVGYSHPVNYELAEGIDGAVEKNVITVSGIDKQLVGAVAAEIRKIRKPEPYKGKGIKYMDEVIRRKAGKAAKAA